MDIAAKTVFSADSRCNGVQTTHRFVRIARQAGTEEQPIDLSCPQVLHKNIGGFLNTQRASANVILTPQRTIQAIVIAGVGNERLKQNGLAAVGKCDGVNPVAVGAALAVFIFGAGTGAGQVVLAVPAEDLQFFKRIRLTDYRRHFCVLLLYMAYRQFGISFDVHIVQVIILPLVANWKGCCMTKIQIATKAAWNGLFLLLFGETLAIFYDFSSRSEQMKLSWVVFFLVICAFLVLVLFFLHNFSLPLRLTGATAIYAEQNWRIFFIKTNRLVCVFIGLTLLGRHLRAIDFTAFLIVGFFPTVRDWFTLWVEGNVSFAIEKVFIAVTYIFYPFGFLFFCGYLIFGADHFVRRQINLFNKHIAKEVLQ